MVTTIQISEDLRDNLLEYKINSKISYEEIIRKLLIDYKKSQKEEEKLLIDGYKEMSNFSKKINNEWEQLDLGEMRNLKN